MFGEADDFEVTPAMRAYLAAFDAWLRDPSDERWRVRREALGDLRRSRYGHPLSDREREVLTLRVAGEPRRRIAERLGITRRTVDHHFEHISEKAGTSDPFRLALWAADRGLTS